MLIGIEYAPVNPTDLYLMMGYYAVKPDLSSVVGNKGVGTVIAVGSDVTNLKLGDRVAPPVSSFTWRERLVAPSKGLVSLPTSADPKQLAMGRHQSGHGFAFAHPNEAAEAGRLGCAKRCQLGSRRVLLPLQGNVASTL